jgi:hypothetical protein
MADRIDGKTFMAALLGPLSSPARADERSNAQSTGDSRYCTATANALLEACEAEVEDNLWKARAICINVSDRGEKAACNAEARAARLERERSCRLQREGRRQACRILGEDRYDPAIDPDTFESDFSHPTNPNRYFPLGIGYRWEYRGGGETNTLEVLSDTKLIEGVTCIAVRDQVFRDGDLAENTDDWFALGKNGNVWYFGEEVKDFESFDGDNPRLPELVSIDGSFKWGREGDKGGVFFRATPVAGSAYREEFSLGNAEDVTEVLSTTYAYGTRPDLDRFVPPALAALLCAGDCVVTRNYSLLEPGVFAHKYYAPRIGAFLEVTPATGKASQLVSCNFDSRCSALPAP